MKYSNKDMGKKNIDKKYDLFLRLIGSSSTLLFIGAIFFIASAGLSLASCIVLSMSVAGLVGPSIAVGGGLIETITGVFELILEGIQTGVEVVVDIISSIFG